MTTIARQAEDRIKDRLQHSPAVILEGSRRIGKTTVARKICDLHETGGVYFDLNNDTDFNRLGDPERALAEHEDKLIVFDDMSRRQELFSFLRYFIDKQVHEKANANKFLLISSVSDRLFRKQRTTLTGRVSRVHMSGLNCLEVPRTPRYRLWDLGGYPQSLLAENFTVSEQWRSRFMLTAIYDLRKYLTGALNMSAIIGLLGLLLRAQGSAMNKSELARRLKVSPKTVGSYLELLEYLFLIRELPCYVWSNKAGKRLTRASKYYVRDSGLVHVFNHARIDPEEGFHPEDLKQASWKGFVIENLISVFAPGWRPHFYRTHNGAEVDLVIVFPGQRLWTVLIDAGTDPSDTRGYTQAINDLQPDRSFIVHRGNRQWFTKNHTFVSTLSGMMETLINEQGGKLT